MANSSWWGVRSQEKHSTPHRKQVSLKEDDTVLASFVPTLNKVADGGGGGVERCNITQTKDRERWRGSSVPYATWKNTWKSERSGTLGWTQCSGWRILQQEVNKAPRKQSEMCQPQRMDWGMKGDVSQAKGWRQGGGARVGGGLSSDVEVWRWNVRAEAKGSWRRENWLWNTESLVSGASCGTLQDVAPRANCTTGGAVTEGYCSMAAASPGVINKIIRIQRDRKIALNSTYYLIAQSQWGRSDMEVELKQIDWLLGIYYLWNLKFRGRDILFNGEITSKEYEQSCGQCPCRLCGITGCASILRSQLSAQTQPEGCNQARPDPDRLDFMSNPVQSKLHAATVSLRTEFALPSQGVIVHPAWPIFTFRVTKTSCYSKCKYWSVSLYSKDEGPYQKS